MGWRQLLQKPDERVVLPWFGGRVLRDRTRAYRLDGPAPTEHGWHRFVIDGRKVRWREAAAAAGDLLQGQVAGYLVADRMVLDHVVVHDDPRKLSRQLEPVFLIEPGLERFARVRAGRCFEGGPLVYDGLDFPLGPEDEVGAAFVDRTDIGHIRGVVPALDGAFRVESWRRAEVERRREEARARRQEQEQLRREGARRRQLRAELGDGRGRRAMAQFDFSEAAKAALAMGGAEYLDHRRGHLATEMVVQFRVQGRRFVCTCEADTLRIIDSGICLVDHVSDERGDRYFTLESLPGVIQQAEREARLVVFHHLA